MDKPVDGAEALARTFRETYERLAPSFGYETRPDTKAFDPTTPNGQLMTAVCGEVSAALVAENERLREALEEANRQLEYVDGRFPTGTTPAVLVRGRTALETRNG